MLDEPNANLDSNGPLFYANHKLPLLSVVDKVIIMSDGVIYDIGPKDEILSRLVAPLPDITEDKHSSASS